MLQTKASEDSLEKDGYSKNTNVIDMTEKGGSVPEKQSSSSDLTTIDKSETTDNLCANDNSKNRDDNNIRGTNDPSDNSKTQGTLRTIDDCETRDEEDTSDNEDFSELPDLIFEGPSAEEDGGSRYIEAFPKVRDQAVGGIVSTDTSQVAGPLSEGPISAEGSDDAGQSKNLTEQQPPDLEKYSSPTVLNAALKDDKSSETLGRTPESESEASEKDLSKEAAKGHDSLDETLDYSSLGDAGHHSETSKLGESPLKCTENLIERNCNLEDPVSGQFASVRAKSHGTAELPQLVPDDDSEPFKDNAESKEDADSAKPSKDDTECNEGADVAKTSHDGAESKEDADAAKSYNDNADFKEGTGVGISTKEDAESQKGVDVAKSSEDDSQYKANAVEAKSSEDADESKEDGDAPKPSQDYHESNEDEDAPKPSKDSDESKEDADAARFSNGHDQSKDDAVAVKPSKDFDGSKDDADAPKFSEDCDESKEDADAPKSSEDCYDSKEDADAAKSSKDCDESKEDTDAAKPSKDHDQSKEDAVAAKSSKDSDGSKENADAAKKDDENIGTTSLAAAWKKFGPLLAQLEDLNSNKEDEDQGGSKDDSAPEKSNSTELPSDSKNPPEVVSPSLNQDAVSDPRSCAPAVGQEGVQKETSSEISKDKDLQILNSGNSAKTPSHDSSATQTLVSETGNESLHGTASDDVQIVEVRSVSATPPVQNVHESPPTTQTVSAEVKDTNAHNTAGQSQQSGAEVQEGASAAQRSPKRFRPLPPPLVHYTAEKGHRLFRIADGYIMDKPTLDHRSSSEPNQTMMQKPVLEPQSDGHVTYRVNLDHRSSSEPNQMMMPKPVLKSQSDDHGRPHLSPKAAVLRPPSTEPHLLPKPPAAQSISAAESHLLPKSANPILSPSIELPKPAHTASRSLSAESHLIPKPANQLPSTELSKPGASRSLSTDSREQHEPIALTSRSGRSNSAEMIRPSEMNRTRTPPVKANIARTPPPQATSPAMSDTSQSSGYASTDQPIPPGMRPRGFFACGVQGCAFSSRNSSDFKIHLLTFHSGSGCLPCVYCRTQCISEDDLIKHLHNHSNNKQFQLFR